MTTDILKVKNINKNFQGHTGKDFGIKNISFEVKPGEVISIVGPSGSGKSTMLRLLAGLEKADSGEISYSDGIKPLLVSQDYNLWPHMTVLENIVTPLVSVKKISTEQAKEIAEGKLKEFGVWEQRDKYPASLSGGQRQRVALLRAVAFKPGLLLLDEITSALDPVLIEGVLNMIKVLAKDNQAMIVVTHHLRFAIEISDRIFYLEGGEIKQMATPDDFIYSQTDSSINNFIKELSSKKQEIKIYEGYDQFQAFQLGILKRFKEGSSKCVVGSSGDRWFECMGEFYNQYEEERIKRKVSWKMIMQEESPRDRDLRIRLPELNNYRILPKNMKNPANYYVIEDTVVVQIFQTETGEPTIIEIKNKAVAESYQKYFDVLWEMSEKLA